MTVRIDATTVTVRVTPSAVDTKQSVDAATVQVVLGVIGVDALYRDASTVRVSITVTTAEVYGHIDTATVRVTLTASGTDDLVRPMGFYMHGVLTDKWTGVLNEKYVGVLAEARWIGTLRGSDL